MRLDAKFGRIGWLIRSTRPERVFKILAAFAWINVGLVAVADSPTDRDLALVAESRRIAWMARHNLTESDPGTALALTLEAVPNDLARPDRPVDRFAEGALYEALVSLRERVFLVGHTGGIFTAIFSPDGSRVLTGARDDTVRLWSSTDGHQLAVFGTSDDRAVDGSFSPDGTRIIVGYRDGLVRIWDTSSAKLLLPLPGLSEAASVLAYSPDGSRVVAGSTNGFVGIWDSWSGAPVALFRAHEKWIQLAAFSSDGSKLLTSGFGESARVWDARTGQALFTLLPEEKCAQDVCEVAAAVFYPDGKRVAVLTSVSLSIWDSGTGQKVTEAERVGGWTLDRMAVSSDGSKVATSASGSIQIWDASTGRLISTISHQPLISSLGFSPDGSLIVTGSDDHLGHVWDVRSRAEIMKLAGHQGSVEAASFAPDGKRILTGSIDGSARIWSTDSAVAPIEADSWLWRAKFSSDSKKIIGTTKDLDVHVLNAATGKRLLELKGRYGGITAVSISPDGRLIATGGDDTARLWDAATGEQIRELRGHAKISDVSFSPDSSLLATVSADRTVRVWNTSTGALLFSNSTNERSMRALFSTTKARFSPTGSFLVTTSSDGVPSDFRPPQVWSTKTGSEVAELRGHSDVVFDVAFSPDGQKILTASRDATARIWDASTGHQLVALLGHSLAMTTAVYSPDGSRVLTANVDATARVWDSTTGRQIYVLRTTPSNGGLDDARYSADGSLIVASDSEGRIYLWDAQTGQPILTLKSQNSAQAILSPDGSRVFAGDRIFPLLKGQALVDQACKVLPRALTSDQRRQMLFDPQPSKPTCGIAPLEWVRANSL